MGVRPSVVNAITIVTQHIDTETATAHLNTTIVEAATAPLDLVEVDTQKVIVAALIDTKSI